MHSIIKDIQKYSVLLLLLSTSCSGMELKHRSKDDSLDELLDIIHESMPTIKKEMAKEEKDLSTLLAEALAANNVEALRGLIIRGIPINDESGLTRQRVTQLLTDPLEQAAIFGDSNFEEYLRIHGPRSSETHALFYAIGQRQWAAVALLLEYEPGINLTQAAYCAQDLLEQHPDDSAMRLIVGFLQERHRVLKENGVVKNTLPNLQLDAISGSDLIVPCHSYPMPKTVKQLEDGFKFLDQYEKNRKKNKQIYQRLKRAAKEFIAFSGVIAFLTGVWEGWNYGIALAEKFFSNEKHDTDRV